MANNFNLKSICGDDLIHYFEGIDYESFVNLQPAQIKEAIPNVIHRIMFENRFEKFLKTNEKITNPSVVIDNRDGTDTDATNKIINYNFCEEPIFDENFTLINVASSSTVSKTTSYSQIHSKKPIAINTIQDIIDIPDIDVKIIVTKYTDQTKPMGNHERITLGKAVIHFLLVNDFERMIAKSEFIKLSELIVQLFPYEKKGTFYTPAVTGEPAQGKLYAAYQNYNTQLREAGLRRKREKEESEESEEVDADRALLQEKSDALKFVLEKNDDFELIKTAWKLCFNERQRLLNEFSTFEYMRRFPAFDLPTGYELLILDANELYPDKSSKLLEFAPKILLFASQKRRAPSEVKSLILGFEEAAEDLQPESPEFHTLEFLTAIWLLPHLMPNPKRKLAKSEVSKFFCPYFKTASSADEYNKKFNEENKNTSLALKPRLYFIGDLPNPRAILRIGNNTYTIEDPITSFEIILKSYLALNCPYPDETKHIWLYIQKEIYEIETGKEKQVATVETFIQDFTHFINSN